MVGKRLHRLVKHQHAQGSAGGAAVQNLRVDAGYSFYWLASDKDRWSNANLRDKKGNSGNFIGHEFDIRARYALSSKIETTVGYAHFTPGNFTRNTGKRDNTDFLYLEISVSAF